VDGALCVAGEHLDQAAVGGFVRAPPDVLGVELERVVLAERGLDAALSLGRVTRLERALRGDGDAGTRPLRRHAGGQAGGPAADHEHIERAPPRHRPQRYHI
jgi:hypothetical protein